MRNATKLPAGKLIKCEGVVLTSSGRVKKMKIRDSELKKLSNPKKRKPAKKRKTKKQKTANRKKK